MLHRREQQERQGLLQQERQQGLRRERGLREKRQGKSPEAIQRIHERNAVKKLERLLNANFGPGDMLAHLTMARTCSFQDMQKEVRNYIQRVKRKAGKRGAALQYVYVIETTGEGKKERHHLHAVMAAKKDGKNVITRDEMEAMWKNGLARVDRAQKMEKGLCGFANYITQKKETQRRLMARRWGASKGLVNPEKHATVSDRKFSRAAAQRIAQGMETDAREILEKKYPGYRLVEMPVVRYSEWLPGCYIYAFMERKTGMRT